MDDGVTGTKIDFVTICYFKEIHLLKLQARSFAKMVDPGIVGKIFVIANGPSAEFVVDYFTREIAGEYGPLSERVILLHHRQVAPEMPDWGHGWRTQQVLKLCIARHVEQKFYVVMDSKNQFVRHVDLSHLISDEGRPRAWTASYRQNSEEHMRASFGYFDIDPEPYIDSLFPSITPIILEKTVVTRMVDYISDKESMPFEIFFVMMPARNLTEFLLYYAYILKLGINIKEYYATSQKFMVTLFLDKVSCDNRFQSVMFEASRDDIFAFGVHAVAMAALTPHQVEVISKFWHERGLISCISEASEYLKLGELPSVRLESE